MCSASSSCWPRAASKAMVTNERSRSVRCALLHTAPHTPAVMKSWNGRSKAVALAVARSTWASPSTRRRVLSPLSCASSDKSMLLHECADAQRHNGGRFDARKVAGALDHRECGPRNDPRQGLYDVRRGRQVLRPAHDERRDTDRTGHTFSIGVADRCA